ncbi:hypothetical protein [Micromonospora sp. NPDC005806]|uniref:hypothetical protein n=1 Tax=Micromonospora sp. NPDC005806 TaxID=3364234 RepID=UPI0036995478
MTTYGLGTDFTGAPLLPSYTDGRLLRADDLTTDQGTLLLRDRWAGQAAGAGIVTGLEVTPSATTLSVAPGLAINRAGEPVSLTSQATLALAIPLAEVATRDNAAFSCCDSGPAGGGSSVGAGRYLLTARPAGRSSGDCTTMTAAGLEFRVTTLPIGTDLRGIPLTTANGRNLVASWCFGADQLAGLPIDPFDFAPALGVDQLAEVTADDVPLAVFAWDGQTVGDLDNWSVRRRVTAPEPGAGGWHTLTADRRDRDGQARFHQFQDQVAEYLDRGMAGKIIVSEYLPLLPPVGFLPVAVDFLTTLGKRVRQDAELIDAASAALIRPGFDLGTFFGNLARFGGVVDFEVAELMLRESWYRPPAVMADPAAFPQGVQPITVYLIRENLIQLGRRIPEHLDKRRLRIPATLYAVFVANYGWYSQSLAPVILADSVDSGPRG